MNVVDTTSSIYHLVCLCQENDVAIQYLCTQQPQMALSKLIRSVSTLKSIIVQLDEEIPVSSHPGTLSHMPCHRSRIEVPLLLNVCAITVAPLVDVYTRAFRFSLYFSSNHEDSQQHNDPHNFHDNDFSKYIGYSKSHYDVISMMLLYNLGLAYHLWAMMDSSKLTRALSNARTCYSRVLQLISLSMMHQNGSRWSCHRTDTTSARLTNVVHVHTELQYIFHFLPQLNTMHHQVLRVLLLASIHNLSHIYETLFETRELLQLSNIGRAMFLQISFLDQHKGHHDDINDFDDVDSEDSSLGSIEYCDDRENHENLNVGIDQSNISSCEDLMEHHNVNSDDYESLESFDSPSSLLPTQPTLFYSSLTDEDISFFFFALFTRSVQLLTGAPAA
jgi:hypothetical protein